MVFANRALSNLAVEGLRPPSAPIDWPYRGLSHDTTKYIPETTVE